MSRFRMALAGLVVAAGLLIPAGAAQAESPAPAAVPAAHQVAAVPGASVRTAAGTLDGCPSGDVCMYTAAGWRSQQPEHEYYLYGCYNLSNETGTRIMTNNQTGGATATGYDNYGCTDSAWTLQDHHEDEYNITPINSISLNP